MAGAKSGKMISEAVQGFMVGQRVRVCRNSDHPSFCGRIAKVVVPKRGERFALIIDINGRHHYADFHELEDAVCDF